MCGIAGWIDWDQDLTREHGVLAAMTATMTCRGPDAEGAWVSQRAALLHRRLVVVDPAGGAQPMVSNRGGHRCVLIYNGELYNTEDIRTELVSLGHRFAGHSDTEVLLAAYLEWDAECLERLNGIFAFAVWEEDSQRLFLARDRLGVKPLFYARRGSALVFGSELKALLAHPAVEPVVDAEGLGEIFALGPARTPGNGVFKDVHELRPGWYLTWDRGGLRQRPYWELTSRPHEDDLDTTVAVVRELLQDAARRQLVSDVPICTLLSGGLDSSSLTALAATALAEAGRGALHTFSIDYVDNDRHFTPSLFQPDADAPWVQRMASHLGTVHHACSVDTPELVAALRAATVARDLPGMADVDSSLLLFCRQIKEHATVALSGECADEIFGGYPWFRLPEALAAGTFPWARATRERAAWLHPEVRAYVQPEQFVQQRYRMALSEVPRLHGEDPGEARRREMSYLNLTRFMPTLLDRKDRMSMAAGLEVRVPFCDHRIVEYVWNVPWAMKYAREREKGLLRLALTDILPEDVLWRRKSPYPKTHNPAYLQAVRQAALAVLDDPGSPLLPLIDVAAIRAVARRDGAASGTPWFGQLMGTAQLFAYLVQADTWLRTYNVTVH